MAAFCFPFGQESLRRNEVLIQWEREAEQKRSRSHSSGIDAIGERKVPAVPVLCLQITSVIHIKLLPCQKPPKQNNNQQQRSPQHKHMVE